MADSFVNLEPDQILDERPFTHPAHTSADKSILGSILECLRDKMRSHEELPSEPRPLVLFEKTAENRRRRIVICNPEQLLADRQITIVGFMGVKRPDVDRTPLDLVDEELIAGFPQFPGVLSYCSVQQASGNWANLVLLRDPSDLSHWASGPRHAFAAKAMAPDYYEYIRLHNAVLEGGVLSDSAIVIHQTKYYDYDEVPPWRAVREHSSE